MWKECLVGFNFVIKSIDLGNLIKESVYKDFLKLK